MDFNHNSFLINSYLFDKEYIHTVEQKQDYTVNFPVIYILYDPTSKVKRAYIGESTNLRSRMSSHLSNTDKKKLKFAYVISSQYFNKSAALDIESNLIKYMSADTNYDLLNGNAGIANHDYFQKDNYFQIFQNIWDRLKLQHIVKKDILEIDNSDLFKYSPYKSLTSDQSKAVINYLSRLAFKQEGAVFIEGSAGTGKTILAVYLIKLLSLKHIDLNEIDSSNTEIVEQLQKLTQVKEQYQDLKIGLVVPMTSLRKTLKNVFRSIPGLTANMVIGPSDVTKKSYDVLIVDEAHRLKRRVGITNYKSFDDTNKKLGLSQEGTELDWILMSSKYQMFFYDEAQSIRPSDIPKERYMSIKNNNNTIPLVSQLRVSGGTDYITFVHHLLTKPNSEVLKPFNSKDYDLKVFTNLREMITALDKKENEFGLTRMTAGFAWKWISNKIDKPDAIIDGVEMTWNRVAQDWINSTAKLTEMGCIHTTQGYDLNYCGVIFGKEIIFNEETQHIEVVKENYFDSKGKNGIKDPKQLHDYIVNIYKTLMFRGIKGTYVYCCDKGLERCFMKYLVND